jgi:hypothetical protein
MRQLFVIVATSGMLILIGCIVLLTIYHHKRIKRWEAEHPDRK